MADSGQFYKGYLIWRDTSRWWDREWVLRLDPLGDQPGENTARFLTLKAAQNYVDRNPRQEVG